MSVAPQFAARQQFLAVLNEFFERGCERWQRKRGWRPAAELPPGAPVKPLRVAAFVTAECDEASYKFWMGVRKGAQDGDATAVLTRRVFEQFLRRAEACEYFRREETEELKRYFDNHYWPIEEAWLIGRRALIARAALFEELGGRHAVAQITTDVQAFHAWSQAVIGEAYNGNDYQRALQVCEAVVMEASAIVARDFNERDVVFGLCAVQEAAGVATMARLNCWAPQPSGFLDHLDDIARSRITPRMLEGSDRQLLGRFATVATMLKAACSRFENLEVAEPSLHAIYTMLGYIRFHQGIRARVADETRCPVDSMTVTLMLTEAVSLRADWLRAFGLYGRMREVPDFTEKAGAHLSALLGGNEEPGLVDLTLAFMAAPHELIDMEWSAAETGIASSAGWNDVALAVLGAKVSLQEDVLDLMRSHAWLNRAKDRLDGCGVQLAWSDFYCACDAYMQERGNATLCDYALNSVRKLQRKAGNASAVDHYAASVLEVASRRKRKPPAGQQPDDMDLQWFLREEPPPLSAR